MNLGSAPINTKYSMIGALEQHRIPYLLNR